MKIKTDYEETLDVYGRCNKEGGAHISLIKNDIRAELVSLSIPQVKALRKALKKAAGL